jgi:MFS transporter, FHS family, L-fucose permease
MREKLTTRENLVPFILVTALFFLWGIAHGLLDVLNKHFQEILQISKARSGLIQFAMYTAYFTMALPASLTIRNESLESLHCPSLILYEENSYGAFLITAAFNKLLL